MEVEAEAVDGRLKEAKEKLSAVASLQFQNMYVITISSSYLDIISGQSNYF